MWSPVCKLYDLKVKPTYEELEEYVVQLEKAFNKACEELASLSYECNMRKASPYAYDCDYTKEEEWREWCLKDETN